MVKLVAILTLIFPYLVLRLLLVLLSTAITSNPAETFQIRPSLLLTDHEQIQCFRGFLLHSGLVLQVNISISAGIRKLTDLYD